MNTELQKRDGKHKKAPTELKNTITEKYTRRVQQQEQCRRSFISKTGSGIHLLRAAKGKKN